MIHFVVVTVFHETPTESGQRTHNVRVLGS